MYQSYSRQPRVKSTTDLVVENHPGGEGNVQKQVKVCDQKRVGKEAQESCHHLDETLMSYRNILSSYTLLVCPMLAASLL
jgi:hypothetical protein